VLVRFSRFLITVGVVTARTEEVDRVETHEMDILGLHTSSIASSLQSVSTDQDIYVEAQSVISQPEIEGVTSIWPCCPIPRRLFRSVTGSGDSGGSDAPEMNIDQSRSRHDDVNHTTSDRLTQAEAQNRACLFPNVETPMA
jgi:hypothetical protein